MFRCQFAVRGSVQRFIVRIGTLSGGQKSRVAFALCSWRKPHLLVLDEPTNHLDMDTIEALIVALGSGGVMARQLGASKPADPAATPPGGQGVKS